MYGKLTSNLPLRSEMRVGLRNLKSKKELFVTIITERKLSKLVLKSSILDGTVVLDPV